jgi:FAD-dependent urate hydroxylase
MSHLPGQRIPLTADRWPTREDMVRYFDDYVRPDFVRPERPIDMIRFNSAGWSDLVDQVLATLTDDDLAASPFPHFRHPIPRSPRQGAVTLLGDAAHTMPPILAQGTNQALLDTMVLCRARSDFRNPAIGSSGELSTALRWYEKTRRRRLTAVSWVTSRQMSQSEAVLKPAAMTSDSFGTWAMTTFLRSIIHRRISAEVNRDVSSRLVRS